MSKPNSSQPRSPNKSNQFGRLSLDAVEKLCTRWVTCHRFYINSIFRGFHDFSRQIHDWPHLPLALEPPSTKDYIWSSPEVPLSQFFYAWVIICRNGTHPGTPHPILKLRQTCCRCLFEKGSAFKDKEAIWIDTYYIENERSVLNHCKWVQIELYSLNCNRECNLISLSQ